MTTKILVNDVWVNGEPTEEDQPYRVYHSATGYRQDNYKAPVAFSTRIITKRSFMKRIKQADRILIRKSTDDIVIDIHEDLKLASSVDLDDEDVTDSIAYLASKNLLDNTDIAALVADGTIEESI